VPKPTTFSLAIICYLGPYQVITSVPAGDKFDAWKESDFAPEAEFLTKIKSIDGLSTVETQTYTIMPM
jgi:hypothetical protein